MLTIKALKYILAAVTVSLMTPFIDVFRALLRYSVTATPLIDNSQTPRTMCIELSHSPFWRTKCVASPSKASAGALCAISEGCMSFVMVVWSSTRLRRKFDVESNSFSDTCPAKRGYLYKEKLMGRLSGHRPLCHGSMNPYVVTSFHPIRMAHT